MELGQHILAALEGTKITKEIETLILKEKILGFTLFKRNIQSAEQVKSLNEELQALAKQAGYQLILAVDQEGGRVARLTEPEFTKIPPMREWAQHFEKTNEVEPFFELGKILGNEVSSVGFNLDFAPLIDIDTNPDSPIIGDRSFSKHPEVVYKLARQVVRGLLHENVIPCLKHFPGHGDTKQDSHEELPIDQRDATTVYENDLLPYKKLIAENLAPTIMTAHVLYPKIDKEHPATMSKKILSDILRKQLSYNGVIFSDDLNMKAITNNYGQTEAAKQFFSAGGDVVLICEFPERAHELIKQLQTKENHVHLQKQIQAAKNKIDTLKQTYLQKTKHSNINNTEQKIACHREFINQIFS